MRLGQRWGLSLMLLGTYLAAAGATAKGAWVPLTLVCLGGFLLTGADPK